MSIHSIARAVAQRDLTVDIEWTDGSRSTVDMKPFVARGGLMAALAELAIFLHCLYVHSEGESLAWEVFGQMADFHADGLWAERIHRLQAAE